MDINFSEDILYTGEDFYVIYPNKSIENADYTFIFCYYWIWGIIFKRIKSFLYDKKQYVLLITATTMATNMGVSQGPTTNPIPLFFF